MKLGPGYTLRVIWACLKKDIKSALQERVFTILGVIVPVNFLILMSLFVLAGGNAPTAVVMLDRGPYAQQFYASMGNAHSFSLQQANTQDAENMLHTGQIVAVVTIPANFDQKVQQNASVQIGVEINNLQTDFTDDIRRAIPLSITTFYAKAFPKLVNVAIDEHDQYRQDTGYIPYIMVSLLALALALGGINQASVAAAGEWEKETIKELLLSPASREAILFGKLLAALVMSLFSVLVVFLIMTLVVGLNPLSWGETLSATFLCLVLFLAIGALLGTLLKHRLPAMVLTTGVSIPLFFISGAFGPISFSTPALQVLAKIFPLYYVIVLQQHAFHGFILNTYGVNGNTLIVCVYTLGLIVLAALALRRSTVAH